MAKTPAGPIAPSMLDKIIGSLSPVAGLKRLTAKRQLQLMMNYDAASRGRRTGGWRSPASSADAAGYSNGARVQLRNLARDFVRNRPYAERGKSIITGNVVGTGIVPSVELLSGSEGSSRKAEVEAVIRDHLLTSLICAAGQHDLLSAQRLVMNGVVNDGEVLVRRRWRTGRFARGLPLPFQIEIIEPDFLDTWKTSNGQNEVIEGVEYGPTGIIEAYHLLRQHPGAVNRRFQLDSVRVPASEIIHVLRADRPGQVRGVSWFAPVMMTLGDLADYQEGELLKQKIAALMAAFLESDEVGDSILGATPEDEAEAVGLGEIGPGTVTELPPGKTIKFTDPPKIEGYDAFMRQNLSAVAMGLGITYESLAGDLSSVNFSSARMGRMEMDRNVETWQQQVMINRFCVGIERWVKEAWLLRPQLGPVDFRMHWTAPRRPLIDPTKETPAMIKAIDAGLISRQRQQRQLGLDPDTIQRERLEDAERDKAIGPSGGKKTGDKNVK